MRGSPKRGTPSHDHDPRRGDPTPAAESAPLTWLEWWSRIVKTRDDLRHVAFTVGLLAALVLSPLLVLVGVGAWIAGGSAGAVWLAAGTGGLTTLTSVFAVVRRRLARRRAQTPLNVLPNGKRL